MSDKKTVLWISPEIYSKLMFYAHAVDAEVGGYGTVFFDDKENDITVGELFLVKQEVHQTECNLTAEGTANLYEELIEKDEAEKIDNLALWWHSHKNMPAKFSTIDDDLMENWSADYLVSLVINRKGEMSATLMSRVPLLVIGEIDIAINWFDVPEYEDMIDEIKEKVTKVVPKVAPTKKFNPPAKKVESVWDNEHKEWGNKGFNSMTIEEWEKYEEEQEKLFDLELQEWLEEEDIAEEEKEAIKRIASTK